MFLTLDNPLNDSIFIIFILWFPQQYSHPVGLKLLGKGIQILYCEIAWGEGGTSALV